jgi:hypothetical protein
VRQAPRSPGASDGPSGPCPRHATRRRIRPATRPAIRAAESAGSTACALQKALEDAGGARADDAHNPVVMGARRRGPPGRDVRRVSPVPEGVPRLHGADRLLACRPRRLVVDDLGVTSPPPSLSSSPPELRHPARQVGLADGAGRAVGQGEVRGRRSRVFSRPSSSRTRPSGTRPRAERLHRTPEGAGRPPAVPWRPPRPIAAGWS